VSGACRPGGVLPELGGGLSSVFDAVAALESDFNVAMAQRVSAGAFAAPIGA
jgi:hypothetical protein